jgi:glutathione S-transferase
VRRLRADTVTSTVPRLIAIGISHFCEKARWVLDWHRLSYVEQRWTLGVHGILAKIHGAPVSTLPILLEGRITIQGSGEIIDWAERQATRSGQELTVAHSREIERRADMLVGIHVRRLSYAEMLPDMARSVRQELFRGLSPAQRAASYVTWPVTRRVMMRAMDINPLAASQSRSILEAELDWLDYQLADGRPYLAGDCFSRADITVASLLAPFAQSKEMPVFHRMTIPPTLAVDPRRWRDRPVMRFVTALYQSHRAPRVAACAA